MESRRVSLTRVPQHPPVRSMLGHPSGQLDSRTVMDRILAVTTGMSTATCG